MTSGSFLMEDILEKNTYYMDIKTVYWIQYLMYVSALQSGIAEEWFYDRGYQ